MVKLTTHDLQFILNQIKLADQHNAAIAAGVDPGDALRDLVGNPLLPDGLRTVDGSYNNLVPGRESWGASGQPFPRLGEANWVNENDDSIAFGPGAPLTNGNYGGPGTLVDADPRTISNLIVDQTLANPAVIAAALRYAGHSEAEIASTTVLIHTAFKAQPGVLDALNLANAALAEAGVAVSDALQALLDANASEIQAAVAAWQAAQIAAAEAEAVRDAAQADSELLSNLLEEWGVEMDANTVYLPNAAPDEGLSASYNSWFTLFGQFFDHGLDLVAKGGNGTVYMPLTPDDPLYNPASPHTNFMVLTRASIGDDAGNVTTPWVDQNQTYTSHASHQVFLREYDVGEDGKTVATGHLLEGARGMATWGDIKEQARTMLGIDLLDSDVGMVPLLRTDPYGRFIPDPVTGFAQVIVGIGPDGTPNTADDVVVSGTPADPINLSDVGALRLPNAFLDDIAHNAAPGTTYDHDNNPGTPAIAVQADIDDVAGNFIAFDSRGNKTAYDDELLDAHYVTGDGRGNENIGLTAIHHVFHSEHNRQVDEIKATLLASGDPAFIAEWQLPDGSWNGERLFQAARFSTEMQYQHLVFEEFARKIQPDVDIFLVEPDVELNPAIFAEFANVVYRFGHSMLNQTVDRQNADGTSDDMTLFDAFLNPLAFGEVDSAGNVIVDHREAAAAIVRGMTMQVGNEIDEFVTDVLRNQLVGIPLDLAAINIARGRDTGMPTLNQAREQFQDMANGDTLLRAYTSWIDFALNMRNPESVINFIAAYGTHASVEGAATIEGKRDAAMALVFGGGDAPADRLDFLNATGAYAGGTLGGLNNVDLWVGGLAEKKMAFGGMLGSTFSFVFQMQMENLQDSDRFYYLSRTQGLNLLTELENNSLAKMVKKNTDLDGFALPADIFSTPDHILYMDLAKQLALTNTADPEHDNPVLEAISSLVERDASYIRYNGLDHIVIQGTDGNDHIVAGGGDDTVWGEGGDDRIEAGYGVDSINGGAGDDIITSSGTDIGAISVLKGESGNDVIVDGTGMSLIFGGDGKDYIVSGFDDGEIRGGQGDDFIYGGDGMGMLFGNEGNDWIEGGAGFDFIAGDMAELFFNSTIIGHDVLNGGQGDTDYDADSGDDIMFGGEGIQKNIGMWGHDWVVHQGQQQGVDADMRVDIFTTLPNEVLRDRFSQVEGLSGWHGDDVLRGDDRSGNAAEGGTTTDPTPETGFRYNELNQGAVDRIAGLSEIITPEMMQQGQYWATGTWENGATGTTEAIFVGGNILLGGGGSDTIEGRGGDDVIDGDRYLSVKLIGQTKDGIDFSVTSMEDSVTLGGITRSLTNWMIDGRINPGAMQIVREILSENSGEDTAVFWDVIENYEITDNGNGGLTVSHVTQTGAAVDPVTGRNRESDGTDQIYNVEWLQFGDVRISTANLINTPATGAPVIDDLTPTEGQTLTTIVSSIQDENGLGTFSYQWQSSSNGGASWTNVFDNIQLTSDATFTPNNGILGFGGQIGDIVRAVVTFTDGAGHQETLVSAPTGIVGDNWGAVPFLSNVFNGTEGDDIANGTSGVFGAGAADTLNGNGGNDILNGAGGNDTINGGAGNDAINGGAGNDTILWNTGGDRDIIDGGAGTDTVRVTGDTSAETFGIYTRAAAVTAGFTGVAPATEIVLTRNGAVIAELDNIEEIVINTLNVTANDGGGLNQGPNSGDTIQVFGNFAGTSLNYSTITIEGSKADDMVDLSALESAHRVVFKSGGGNDTIIGQMREQDRFELAEGKTLDDYEVSGNADGSTTLATEGHTVTFFGTMANAKLAGTQHHDDDHDDDDDDAIVTPPPVAPSPNDSLTGTGANDHLKGGSGNNVISGLGGDDVIDGGSGDDVLAGNAGDDRINGGSGDDIIRGGSGDDHLSGGSGDDLIEGGDGDDILLGGSGDDRLDGGDGDDVMSGGSGDDVFVFGNGDDRVTDFDGDEDTIDLSGLGITAQSFGSRVVISQDGDDAIIRIDGQSMRLDGVGSAGLMASSFVFATAGGAPEFAEEIPLPETVLPPVAPIDDTPVDTGTSEPDEDAGPQLFTREDIVVQDYPLPAFSNVYDPFLQRYDMLEKDAFCRPDWDFI